MTQTHLGRISGVTAATISAYESADGSKGKNPSLENALKLATALNVSLDWLCGRVEKKRTAREIDSTSFLIYYLQLFNKVSDKNIQKLSENLKSSFNGITFDVYKPITGAKNKKTLYHFTKEYLEVLPVLRKNLLSKEIQQTIIEKILEGYKDIPIQQLLSDGFMIRWG